MKTVSEIYQLDNLQAEIIKRSEQIKGDEDYQSEDGEFYSYQLVELVSEREGIYQAKSICELLGLTYDEKDEFVYDEIDSEGASLTEKMEKLLDIPKGASLSHEWYQDGSYGLTLYVEP